MFLEGPGVITAQRYLVSESFISRVQRLDVGPGASVEKGQIIGEIASFEVDTYITNLIKILADQYAVDSELRVRLEVSAATLETSKKRAKAAQDAARLLEAGPNEAASAQFRSDVFREQALAELTVAQSNAELTEAVQQRLRLTKAQTLLEGRLARFQAEFNEGTLSSPITGIIGPKIAVVGETVLPGNAILEILDNKATFVEWNIPPNRWRHPRVGDVVFINDGTTTSEGKVAELLALSSNYSGTPLSGFATQEYGQIAHVVTNDPASMSNLNTRVTVRMNYSAFANFFGRYLGWL